MADVLKSTDLSVTRVVLDRASCNDVRQRGAKQVRKKKLTMMKSLGANCSRKTVKLTKTLGNLFTSDSYSLALFRFVTSDMTDVN